MARRPRQSKSDASRGCVHGNEFAGCEKFSFWIQIQNAGKDLWSSWDLQSSNSCMLRVAVMLRNSSSTGLVCIVAELLVHCWWFWGYVTEIWITFRYARERKWHKLDRNVKNAANIKLNLNRMIKIKSKWNCVFCISKKIKLSKKVNVVVS